MRKLTFVTKIIIRFGIIRFGIIRFGIIRFDIIRFGIFHGWIGLLRTLSNICKYNIGDKFNLIYTG